MPDSINPNDTVRVKLTETGKRLIVADIDDINGRLRERGSICRIPVPRWDSDGWVSDQFHSLMSRFDGQWGLGGELPFTHMEKVQ